MSLVRIQVPPPTPDNRRPMSAHGSTLEPRQRGAAAAPALELPFTGLSVTVAARGSSLQDRAREARHAALDDLADAVGATAIALAHTADDQAEPVLMRALSGATPRA